MKLLAYLLITVCLCFGAIAATTAYVPTLDSLEEALAAPDVRIRLAAPAGIKTDTKGKAHPLPLLAPADVAHLTLEHIQMLRDNGVERVRVKEFSFGRWSLSWLFLLAVVGLIAGGLMVKREVRREIRAHMERPDASEKSPENAILAIRVTIGELRQELAAIDDPEQRTGHIVDRLGELQQTHMEVVVAARAELISQFGLAGFAALMDRFATLERQINRAWSAAADGVYDEALDCLRKASDLSTIVAEFFHRGASDQASAG